MKIAQLIKNSINIVDAERLIGAICSTAKNDVHIRTVYHISIDMEGFLIEGLVE